MLRVAFLRPRSISVPNVSNKWIFQTKIRKNSTKRPTVSKEERAKLRASRRARAAVTMKEAQGQAGNNVTANATTSTSTSASTTGTSTGTATVSATATSPKPSPTSSNLSAQNTRLLIYSGITIPSLMIGWAIYDPEESPPGKLFSYIGVTQAIQSFWDEFAKPSHPKLLPDWSQMPNVPQDIPIPHTLVLDLEQTLVSSTWDRKYGWRHAKRPGVDKFLHDMAQYYEIVLYSPSHDGVADPVVNTLDKHGSIMHRLYRDSTHYINGTHAKDLSKLNRNLNRIVAIDDDALALQLQPRNLIRVKPYTDPHDRSDATLARITPLLIEIAREGCQNVPALLDQFRGMDADEMAEEHEKRIKEVRRDRERRAQRGLGKLSMGGKRHANLVPELQASVESVYGNGPKPANLTSKDLVGPAPSKEAGGVVGWLNKRQKEQQEEQMRKMEKWNEVMMKKQQEKKKREEQMAKQMAA